MRISSSTSENFNSSLFSEYGVFALPKRLHRLNRNIEFQCYFALGLRFLVLIAVLIDGCLFFVVVGPLR